MALTNSFQEFGLSKYEAMALEALIKYAHLDARLLADKSGVPQPKIYDTVNKLEAKGLAETIQLKGKKIFRITSKTNLNAFFSSKLDKLQEEQEIIEKSVNDLYNQEKTDEVSLFGVIGQENIVDSLCNLIQNAEISVKIALPMNYFTPELMATINANSPHKKISVINQKSPALTELSHKLQGVEVFHFKHNGFKNVKKFFKGFSKMIPGDGKEAFGYNFLSKILLNIENIFGLALFDDKVSIFLIPMHLKKPIAMVSSESEIIDIHTEGINNLLARGILLQPE